MGVFQYSILLFFFFRCSPIPFHYSYPYPINAPLASYLFVTSCKNTINVIAIGKKNNILALHLGGKNDKIFPFGGRIHLINWEMLTISPCLWLDRVWFFSRTVLSPEGTKPHSYVPKPVWTAAICQDLKTGILIAREINSHLLIDTRGFSVFDN